jgi:hexosaminidase
VPLVQTFGHLEFALKHDELANIREIESHMDSLCPLKEESFTFITRMIDQVLSYHPNTKYIHLGGDEVRSLGIYHL